MFAITHDGQWLKTGNENNCQLPRLGATLVYKGLDKGPSEKARLWKERQ